MSGTEMGNIELAVPSHLMLEQDVEQVSVDALDAVLRSITDGIWILDTSGNIVYSNQRFEQLAGLKGEVTSTACGISGTCYIHCPNGCLFQQMKETGQVIEHEFFQHSTGLWLRATLYPVFARNGTVIGATHVVRDITEYMVTEERHHLLQAAVSQSPDLVMIVDSDLRIEYVNTALEGFIGCSAESLEGVDDARLRRCFGHDGGLALLHKVRKSGEIYRGVVVARDSDEQEVTLEGSVVPLKRDSGIVSHLVCSARDVTQQHRLQERVQHLAYFDALTGLPNRELFLDRLEPALARARHGGRACAIVTIDLDNFKAINDALGTAAGDEVLRSVAHALNETVREGDTVARLGSDEFGIALIDMKWPEDAPQVVQRLESALSQPVVVKGTEVEVSASAGIALSPNDGTDPSDLIRKAGIALSAAKKAGQAGFRHYSEELGEKAADFLDTAARLRQAVEHQEFLAYYQPYYHIATGTLVGMEALIRWNSPDQGIVPPFKFIPVLEETGLIVAVGDWMIREVCGQLARWKAAGKPVVPVAINLSALQFRSEVLLGTIRKVIDETGVEPELLTFEVTESTFMENPEYTRSVLEQLRELGSKVSIDDFGTGYSSLAYLKRFPVDHLKIDRSFVKDIVEDVDDASLVSAIISMAHDLGIQCIAEGVESDDHLRILRILRCDIAQGYLYSPPVPVDQADVFFSTPR